MNLAPHSNNLTHCEPLENTNHLSTSTMSNTPSQYFEPLLYISEFTDMLNDNETIEQVIRSFSNDPTATISFRYIQTMTNLAERMEQDLTDLQNEIAYSDTYSTMNTFDTLYRPLHEPIGNDEHIHTLDPMFLYPLNQPPLVIHPLLPPTLPAANVLTPLKLSSFSPDLPALNKNPIGMTKPHPPTTPPIAVNCQS